MVREEIAVAVKEDRTGEYRMLVVVSSYYRQGRSDWGISDAGCCLVVLSTGKIGPGNIGCRLLSRRIIDREDRTGEYRMPVVVSSYYRQGRSDRGISDAVCCFVVLSTGKMATVMWGSPRLYVLSNPRTVVVHGGEQQNLVMSSIWSDVYSITDGTLSLVMFTWCTKSLLCVMLCSVWMWSAKFALVVFVCSSFLLAAYLRSHPCSWHFAHTYHQCCVPS